MLEIPWWVLIELLLSITRPTSAIYMSPSKKFRAVAQPVLHTSVHISIGCGNPFYHIWLFTRTTLSRAKLALAVNELDTQYILPRQVLFILMNEESQMIAAAFSTHGVEPPAWDKVVGQRHSFATFAILLVHHLKSLMSMFAPFEADNSLNFL